MNKITHMMYEPQGFWEVVGFKPYYYGNSLMTTATFATEGAARKFVKEHGGKVKHREADAILIDGKIVWKKG